MESSSIKKRFMISRNPLSLPPPSSPAQDNTTQDISSSSSSGALLLFSGVEQGRELYDMAAESKEEEIRSRRRRPWTMKMKVEVKGVGGILVLVGAIIAAAFAVHRARIARRRRASASTSSSARPQTPKGQKEECSRALLGSGGVADDGEQHGDGAAQCGAALADEWEEQISLKAEDDVEVQPCVGIWSDKCYSKYGRRRPFIFSGCLMISAAGPALALLADLSVLNQFGRPTW